MPGDIGTALETAGEIAGGVLNWAAEGVGHLVASAGQIAADVANSLSSSDDSDSSDSDDNDDDE